ncbi:MAG: molybdopterin dinucleotide binding domain-containing protein [Promethearchaeota archaeon]
MGQIKVVLTTGGTIMQGVTTKGGGKALPIYTRNVGVIFLDPDDLKELGVVPGTPVKVKSKFNEVIVTAKLSPDAPHKKIAFMPRGPWCNLLVDPQTFDSGTPMYKYNEITIEPAAEGERPLNMPELMKKYYLEK